MSTCLHAKRKRTHKEFGGIEKKGKNFKIRKRKEKLNRTKLLVTLTSLIGDFEFKFTWSFFF